MKTRLHLLLETAAQRWPEDFALHDAEGSWTYRELADAARSYADQLVAREVQPGDRAVVRAESKRWVVATIFACAQIGAVAVPASPDAPAAQQRYIRRNSAARIWLTSADPTSWIVHPRRLPPAQASLILYTSGSTARPTGIVCDEDAVLFAYRSVLSVLQYNRHDVILNRMPLAFDYGLYQVFMATAVGASVVLAGPGSDAGLMNIIQQRGVSVVPLVPTLATMLIQLGRRQSGSPSVRLLTNTGQELPPMQAKALQEIFPFGDVVLMYGTTECKRVSIGEPNEYMVRPGSVGKAIPGTEIHIVGDDGTRLGPYQEGEIVVQGPHLMREYWRDAARTRATFRDQALASRRLHTGDYGHLDAGGNLYFRGRRDDRYKVCGLRTSAVEVEAAVAMIAGVQSCAVVPPDSEREARLFVVASIEAAQILYELRAHLERGKIPRVCTVVEHLPMTTTGKIDRAALREL